MFFYHLFYSYFIPWKHNKQTLNCRYIGKINCVFGFHLRLKPLWRHINKMSNTEITRIGSQMYTHILMGMMQWNHAANMKQVWPEHDRKRDLIRNLNIFSQATLFFVKTLNKHREKKRIYQLVITHKLRWVWYNESTS